MTDKISNSLHWQSSLDDDGIVEGFGDVEQSIRIILSTPKGSVPHRPDFGSEVMELIDGNFTEIAPLFIGRATDAILKHEPRIESIEITAKQYGEVDGFAGAVFNIAWTPIDGLVPQNMTYRV